LLKAGILDELKLELAKRYLQEKDLPISEIAWLLGYRESSAFTHDTFVLIQAALNAYDRDVKDGHFPSETESYELHPANLHIAKSAA
jgi:AraC-like DNA-binding protein